MAEHRRNRPKLLILNQMAGPMTWELAEDAGEQLGCAALLTGHPDTLAKGSTDRVQLHPAAPYVRGSFPRRAWSWIRYSLQALFWLWRWPKGTPILLFSNPPILCWVGWLMRKTRAQRYFVMVHDIYPDVLMGLGGFSERHPLIRLWYWLNRHAYENAEAVMTLGEYMAANLEKQFDSRKTPAGRVEVIPPWVDTERIKPMPKQENWFAKKYDQVDKLTVMYSGNMGLGHDIETMIEAARILQDEPQIHFMFIGSGSKWNLVEQAVSEHGLGNVTLLPWQREDVLPYSLASADVALISLEPELQGLAVPSKAIYAMSAGSHLIVLADGGNDLTHWLDQHAFGSTLEANAAQIARLVCEFLGSPFGMRTLQSRARQVAAEMFSRHGNVPLFLTKVNPYP